MTDERRVVLGRVARPHGLQGEVVVRAVSIGAEALARIVPLELVGPSRRWVRATRITSARPFGEALLVRFDGAETLEEANELRGATLETARAALPEPAPEEMYVFDLVGIQVVDENEQDLGTVREVLASGAHEILEIVPGPDAPDAQPLLVPFHPEFVLGWDPQTRVLRLRVPPGLQDVYRS